MRDKKVSLSFGLFLPLVACSQFSAPVKPVASLQATQTIGRFQVQDHLVVDTSSNLMWTRCLVGANWDGLSCSGKPLLHGWQQGQNFAKSTHYAGFNDWRVPTLNELKTLVDKEVAAPKAAIPHINQAVFPTPDCHGINGGLNSDGHACWQWSSSPIDGSDHYAWIVYFGYGYGSANFEADTFALRLVRNN